MERTGENLRIKLRINPVIEVTVKGGDVLKTMAEPLEGIATDVATIRSFTIPESSLEEARRTGSEVRQINIYGAEREFPRGMSYVVSYETIRGRQLGHCPTYISEDLKRIREQRE